MGITYTQAREKIYEPIDQKKYFATLDPGSELLDASDFLEKCFGQKGLRCRVYTRNRILAAGAMSFVDVGAVSMAGIAAHTLATFNPDYEIVGPDLFKSKRRQGAGQGQGVRG